MSEDTVCPTCGKSTVELAPEEVEARLEALEPQALSVLESQLESLDQRVAQSAAKLLLEWKRGKPKQQIQNTMDQITTIRYESAAWFPDEDLVIDAPEPILELSE